MLPFSVLMQCFLRCGFLNASISEHFLQQTGLIFALEPALKYIYHNEADLKEAFLRYTDHSNTHPYMMPLYLGILLAMECSVATKILPTSTVNSLKPTIATTLSALGDTFFEGALLPCWALCCIIFVLLNNILGAAIITAILLIVMISFRLCSFFYGFKHAIAVLGLLRRLDLVNWSQKIKCVNALLLASIIFIIALESRLTLLFLCIPAITCAGAEIFFAGRLQLPRAILWFMALFFIALTNS